VTSLSLASLTAESLQTLCRLAGHDVTDEPWRTLSTSALSDEDRHLVAFYTAKNFASSATAMNESTVWSRVIYPLLMLAEVQDVKAWSQVPLSAVIPSRESAAGHTLTGVIDGVLAPESPLRGTPGLPYLLVVEAKRGMDASDPRPQMLGAILAAASLKRGAADGPVTRYGCYTVGDVWTFVRARVELAVDDALPTLWLEWSREYTERHEAEVILKVLRGIASGGA
jgi:hypothetical protein